LLERSRPPRPAPILVLILEARTAPQPLAHIFQSTASKANLYRTRMYGPDPSSQSRDQYILIPELTLGFFLHCCPPFLQLNNPTPNPLPSLSFSFPFSRESHGERARSLLRYRQESQRSSINFYFFFLCFDLIYLFFVLLFNAFIKYLVTYYFFVVVNLQIFSTRIIRVTTSSPSHSNSPLASFVFFFFFEVIKYLSKFCSLIYYFSCLVAEKTEESVGNRMWSLV